MDEKKERECVGIFIRKREKEERGWRSRGDTDPGEIQKQSQDRVKWGRKQDRVRSGRGVGATGEQGSERRCTASERWSGIRSPN